MAIRVGINGFGRIGRCVFRAAQDPEIRQASGGVAVNERVDYRSLG